MIGARQLRGTFAGSAIRSSVRMPNTIKASLFESHRPSAARNASSPLSRSHIASMAFTCRDTDLWNGYHEVMAGFDRS